MTHATLNVSESSLTPLAQVTLRQLMQTWFEFERNLAQVPIVKRVTAGTLTLEDYQKLLCHWYPQVIEGARWISQTAASFDRRHLDIRGKVIRHAFEEHRDYNMLVQDYQQTGGKAEVIEAAQRNAGTDALHGFLMYRSGRENPIDMLGAMWMIEGLGEKMAGEWAKHIREILKDQVEGHYTRFMDYHGQHDEGHMQHLYDLLNTAVVEEEVGAGIVKTAQVVGKLYCLQLEEIDRD